MTASGSSDSGGPGPGPSGASAIAIRRAEGEDFSASFLELQDEVSRTCRRRARWEEKVIAGIQATLGFAAASPGKALALTVEARRPAFGDRNPEQVVIAYFAGRLAEVAPAGSRIPVSTDESIVEAVAAIVRGHLLGGTEDQLPATAPDVVYLTLLPYLGLERTKRWAETTVPSND